MSGIVPIPDWRVTLDGEDLTPKMRPRLISLSLTDKRAGEADELQIDLDDSDGKLAIPKTGALLSLEIGWKQGGGVTTGLVSKGQFKVDEVSHSGSPDRVSIRARSADFTAEIRNRREKSWHDSTLGTIVADIAGRNGLKPRCADRLAGIAIKVAVQSRESDLAFLRRLGRAHDAIATVKGGALILSPVGSGATASGKPLPKMKIVRASGDSHVWSRAVREAAEGVSVAWHDRGSAKQHIVTVGKAEGARRLARVYASESTARRAAEAAHSKAERDPDKFSIVLALGRADLQPECGVEVSGFKPVIDETPWLIAEVQHTIAAQGFITTLQMEANP
jgi:phage protein D